MKLVKSKRGLGPLGNFLFGMLAVAVFATSLSTIILQADDNYDLNMNDSGFNTLQELDSLQREIQDNISNKVERDILNASGRLVPDSDTAESQLSVQNKASKIVFAGPGLLRALVSDVWSVLTQHLGLSGIFAAATLTAISLFFILAMLGLFWRVRNP